ncbi:hypothetical protein ACMDB5_13920 [Flavobacterium sp. W1B]|uniref:hypothetical protein n=1 Tax=Flavobacterium sp. W1B TaxID=3394146 RepID=UPI0039BC65DE
MKNTQSSKDKKLQKYSNMVAHKVQNGFKIVESNDTLPFSILLKEGKEVNNNLNFLLFCATFGLWTVPWIYISKVASKPKKILVAIDEDGKIFEEKCYME